MRETTCATGPAPRIITVMPAPADAGPTTRTLPDALGRFGAYGGRFVPETLMDALNRLDEEYARVRDDPEFQGQLASYLADYVGRPSPLFHARRLTGLAAG